MKIDRYVKDLSERVNDFVESAATVDLDDNDNDNDNYGLTVHDDEYYLYIGLAPPRFAYYRIARAKKKIGDTLTFEDVYDTITQDELDYYLKLCLKYLQNKDIKTER